VLVIIKNKAVDLPEEWAIYLLENKRALPMERAIVQRSYGTPTALMPQLDTDNRLRKSHND
jgi:hypothetical protein